MLRTISIQKQIDGKTCNKLFKDFIVNEVDWEHGKMYTIGRNGNRISHKLEDLYGVYPDMLNRYLKGNLTTDSIVAFKSKCIDSTGKRDKEYQGNVLSFDTTIENSNGSEMSYSDICEDSSFKGIENVLAEADLKYNLDKLRYFNEILVKPEYSVDIVLLLKRTLEIPIACKKLQNLIEEPGLEEVKQIIHEILGSGKELVDIL